MLKLQAVLTAAHRDYAKGLKAYAFLKIQNHAVGEELVQDAFMKMWKYLVKRGDVVTMKAFLYHILNNLVVDQYRKHQTVSLDLLSEKGFEPTSPDFDHSFDVIDGKAAMLLILQLPEKYQKVIHMKYVQDFSLNEIALMIGQSKNTTTVQMHRGLKKLRLIYNAAEARCVF